MLFPKFSLRGIPFLTLLLMLKTQYKNFLVQILTFVNFGTVLSPFKS